LIEDETGRWISIDGFGGWRGTRRDSETWDTPKQLTMSAHL